MSSRPKLTWTRRPDGRRVVSQKLNRVEDDDGSFDILYWQELGHQAIFEAAWHMRGEVDRMRGGDGSRPRLQRSVGRVERRRG